MDKAKTLLISSFVGGFCCFAFSIAVLLTAGKPFALDANGNGYEGAGQAHLWKVNYGTTATGLFSAFAYIGLVIFHYKAYKEPTKSKFDKLSGMTLFATFMLLQAAIAYGNEALTANELVKHDPDATSYSILQSCGICSGTNCPTDSPCTSGWTCSDADGGTNNCPKDSNGNALELHLRSYGGNKKITGPANTAVTFAIFMFLLSIFQVFYLNQHMDEIAGGAGGSDYSNVPSGGVDKAPAAAATAGEGYQRL